MIILLYNSFQNAFKHLHVRFFMIVDVLSVAYWDLIVKLSYIECTVFDLFDDVYLLLLHKLQNFIQEKQIVYAFYVFMKYQ